MSLSWSSHPCAHEGHGEVDGSLPDGGDRHVDHRHVRLLRPKLRDHAGPPGGGGGLYKSHDRNVYEQLFQSLFPVLELCGECIKHVRNR